MCEGRRGSCVCCNWQVEQRSDGAADTRLLLHHSLAQHQVKTWQSCIRSWLAAVNPATSLHVVCSNDAFDAQMGVDGDKPESIVNLTGNRLGCLWVANAFLAAGCSLVFSAMLRTV